MKKSFVLLILLGAVFLCTANPAFAVLFGFDNITGNNAVNAAIGETQLFVDVTSSDSQVLFTFINNGPAASSITDVYFDDGSLLGITGLIDADDGVGGDSGVDFSVLATPDELPGANEADPDFETTEGLSADSDVPVQSNGVNPGESLGILFNLQDSQTLTDVLADLANEDLRIGIHVQGFASGGSESFVNDPISNPIPEPATMLLVGSGLIGLAGIGRKKFFKKS